MVWVEGIGQNRLNASARASRSGTAANYFDGMGNLSRPLPLFVAASMLLSACGGSSQSDAAPSTTAEPAQTETSLANQIEESVAVNDELSLVDFAPRCVIDRISDAGSLWFTVELRNEFDDERRFTVSVNTFYDGEFKADHSFDTKEIEPDKRGTDESLIRGVDERNKRLWTCEVYKLEAK